jgi:hypothetical protein
MTNKQIANYIAKKYFTSGEYKLFKRNHNLKIEKDALKIISLLKDEFSLSQSDMEDYYDEIKRTQPMPKTQLLLLITEELAKEGLEWQSREELFEILCPDKSWNRYEDSWHQWLTQYTEDIRNKPILTTIQNSLGFSSDFWKLPEMEQIEKIPNIVQGFLKKNQRSNSNIDFPSIEPKEPKLTKRQQELILELKKALFDRVATERLLQKNIDLFSLKAENQYFLLQVLSILYNNGFYKFLKKHLFPSLFRHHRDRTDIKLKEANTLINLDNSSYEEIYYLLESIKPNSKEEETDILTMKISTFRKHKLKGVNIERDNLYSVLLDTIRYYNRAYQKESHYYPAINLAYMIKLFSKIFPNSKESTKYDIETIYISVQPSIKRDKTEGGDTKYYATMSDLEFCLLLGRPRTLEAIEDSLSILEPSRFLAERPLFQMLGFVDFLEEFTNFDSENRFINSFNQAIDIFENYIRTLY